MSLVRGKIRRTSVELVEAKRFANRVGNELLLGSRRDVRTSQYRPAYSTVLFMTWYCTDREVQVNKSKTRAQRQVQECVFQ